MSRFHLTPNIDEHNRFLYELCRGAANATAEYYGDDRCRDLFATWTAMHRESQLDDRHGSTSKVRSSAGTAPPPGPFRTAAPDPTRTICFGIQYKLAAAGVDGKISSHHTTCRLTAGAPCRSPVMTPTGRRWMAGTIPGNNTQPASCRGDCWACLPRLPKH